MRGGDEGGVREGVLVGDDLVRRVLKQDLVARARRDRVYNRVWGSLHLPCDTG